VQVQEDDSAAGSGGLQQQRPRVQVLHQQLRVSALAPGGGA